MLSSIQNKLSYFGKFSSASKYSRIYKKYSSLTMIGKVAYIKNLIVSEKAKECEGAIVECGVWKGGMIAGLAEIFSDKRAYYLFDSFEGLPGAEPVDGDRAIQWQTGKTNQPYFDNCKAEIEYATKAMQLAKVSNVKIVKGWFKDSLPLFSPTEKIALLRMDGDWYESTYSILENLYQKVVPGGIVIIDDYGAWEGCSRAVHDYLSAHSLPDRISQFENEIYFIQKSSAAK